MPGTGTLSSLLSRRTPTSREILTATALLLASSEDWKENGSEKGWERRAPGRVSQDR